jgi:2-amino-4-hydroxy-6-hydroxymethyldihydropteridine diphosphokinase
LAVIYLSIGSNINRVKNLQLAIDQLGKRFSDLQISRVYENRPVGFDGRDFLNLVAKASTDLAPESVARQLEEIHDIAGRDRQGDRFSPRELDIDLLMYDDLVANSADLNLPRPDILDYAFVLRPLAEIAPQLVHPLTGKTLATHWAEFDQASHPLRPVSLEPGPATA